MPNNERLLTEEELGAFSAELPSYIQMMRKGGVNLNATKLLEAQDAKTASLVRKEVLEEKLQVLDDVKSLIDHAFPRKQIHPIELQALREKYEAEAKLEKEG